MSAGPRSLWRLQGRECPSCLLQFPMAPWPLTTPLHSVSVSTCVLSSLSFFLYRHQSLDVAPSLNPDWFCLRVLN